MIDININAIISQALAAAVQQAIQPLQQEYANKMAEMAQQIAALDTHLAEAIDRIAALEAQSANRHERLRVLEGALTDRVAALENQALVEHDAVDARIAALENNPAQGVDTTLERRIAALEAAEQPLTTFTMDALLERLDNQEWFWNKIRNFTDSAVEQVVENHTDMYDHNDFVTEDKLDDYVTKDSFRDEVEDVLNNATIQLRF